MVKNCFRYLTGGSAGGGTTDITVFPTGTPSSHEIRFASATAISILTLSEQAVGDLHMAALGPLENTASIIAPSFTELANLGITLFTGDLSIGPPAGVIATNVYLVSVTPTGGILNVPGGINLFLSGTTDITELNFGTAVAATVDFTGLTANNPITIADFASTDTLTVYLGDNVANPGGVVDDLVGAGGLNGTLSMNDASTQTGSADLVTAGWTIVDL